jgi:hypothetical protein
VSQHQAPFDQEFLDLAIRKGVSKIPVNSGANEIAINSRRVK